MATILPNSTNCTAYLSTSTDRTNPDILSTIITAGTEYSGAQLITISTDDTASVTAGGGNAAHLLKYRVTGSETQLDFTIKIEEVDGGSGTDIYFYIWNAMGESWSLMDQDTLGAIRTMTGSVTSGVSDYIDGSYDIHVLATSGSASQHSLKLYYGDLVTVADDNSSSSSDSSDSSASSDSSSSSSDSTDGDNSSSSSSQSSSSSSNAVEMVTITAPVWRSFRIDEIFSKTSYFRTTETVKEGAAIAVFNGSIADFAASNVKFIGFAISDSNGTGCIIRNTGVVLLPVSGSPAIGDSVYMTGQNTFGLSGVVLVGKVDKIASATHVWVYFETFTF